MTDSQWEVTDGANSPKSWTVKADLMGKGYGDLLIDVLRLEHEKADLQATMDQLIESRRTWATEAMRDFEPCDSPICWLLGHLGHRVFHVRGRK